MTKYEASKNIPGKQDEPCSGYEEPGCRSCALTYPELNLPPHCGYCGYVREDHETSE